MLFRETGLRVGSCRGGRDCQYARGHIQTVTSWYVEESTVCLEYFSSVPASNAYRPNARDFSQLGPSPSSQLCEPATRVCLCIAFSFLTHATVPYPLTCSPDGLNKLIRAGQF